jgi:aspartyl protease family protein
MSGSSGFTSFVAVIAIVTAAAVYGIKHRDDVARIAAIAIDHTVKPGGSAAAGESEASTKAEPKNPAYGDLEIAADESGHFQTEAEINGSRVDVLVDTGATLVALTYDDARRAGVHLSPSDFTHEVRTANGVAKVAPIDLSSISIGDITVRNVRGAVTEPGKLHKTLLGMSFLSRLSRVEMREQALVLHE